MKGQLALITLMVTLASAVAVNTYGVIRDPHEVLLLPTRFYYPGEMTLHYTIKFPKTTSYITLIMADATEDWHLQEAMATKCEPDDIPRWTLTLHTGLKNCTEKDEMIECNGPVKITWDTKVHHQIFMLVRCDGPKLMGVQYNLWDKSDMSKSSTACPGAVTMSIFTLTVGSLLTKLFT